MNESEEYGLHDLLKLSAVIISADAANVAAGEWLLLIEEPLQVNA